MCGIFFFQSNTRDTDLSDDDLKLHLNKIIHRGPDDTKSIHYKCNTMNTADTFIGFHRLSINDLKGGQQPFVDNNIILICNGEIYNYKSLIKKYSLEVQSNSDCEVILHLYKKIGFLNTIKELDGIFACILYDRNIDTIYAARDPIGVRSMFIYNNNDVISIASEIKALGFINDKYCDSKNITQFKPGNIWDSKTNKYTKYFDVDEIKETNDDISTIKENICTLLTNAVRKQMISDRPIGCLLSGGLDSSLMAALLCKINDESKLEYSDKYEPIKTFSVGLEGSPDVEYARLVAKHIGSDHHELILTEADMLNGIDETIYKLETYDTTTIRAGTPMHLLAKYIKWKFTTTVIFSGEGSDELSGSYMYFHNAPNENEFQSDIKRLVKDLSYFDVLRCDKSMAGAGLEIRVPFLDIDFVNYYLSVPAKLKLPQLYNNKKIEKHLLRSAFDDGLLPDSVLWRKKEGMSDGVSSEKNSWYNIIQNRVNSIKLKTEISDYSFNIPKLKESLYYREIFANYFPNCDHTIPYYWLPKWSGDVTDPSARVLNVY